MTYFSEQELVPLPRYNEIIPPSVWGGIVVVVRKHWVDGLFAYRFPADCPDGRGTSGCSVPNFLLSMRAEIPLLSDVNPDSPPNTLTALDFIQFCFRSAGKPIDGSWHPFYEHSHYMGFDVQEGQRIFREEIETLFERNGIAFRLNEDGSITRNVSSILMSTIAASSFNTGDQTLNDLMDQACKKFLNPDPTERRDSLEKLWDAWERLKTLEPPTNDKVMSVTALLRRISPEPAFRTALNNEAQVLTGIGNQFKIRHTETTQTELQRLEHVDYLFHRLLALMELALKMTNRLR